VRGVPLRHSYGVLVQVRRGSGSLSEIQAELSRRILALTDNGDEVIRFFLGVMRDGAVPVKYRIAAAEWLADRMWGAKPEAIHTNTLGIFESLLQASDEELRRLARGEFEGLPDLTGLGALPEPEGTEDDGGS
jgi:hypothetical protein